MPGELFYLFVEILSKFWQKHSLYHDLTISKLDSFSCMQKPYCTITSVRLKILILKTNDPYIFVNKFFVNIIHLPSWCFFPNSTDLINPCFPAMRDFHCLVTRFSICHLPDCFLWKLRLNFQNLSQKITIKLFTDQSELSALKYHFMKEKTFTCLYYWAKAIN